VFFGWKGVNVNIIFCKAEKFPQCQGKYAPRNHLWTVLIKDKKVFIISFDFYPTFCEIFTGRYCGKTLPEPIKSSTQSLYITFHSDELGPFKGFKAEWSSTPVTTSAVKGNFQFLSEYFTFNFLNFSLGLFLHGKGREIRKPIHLSVASPHSVSVG